MTIFCTKCGTRSDDGSAFCENCGAALAKPRVQPDVTPPEPQRSFTRTSSPTSKKPLYIGLAVAAVLLVGAAGLYFSLAPPAATRDRLMSAAKAGYGNALTTQFKRELCLGNMNYSLDNFNVGENDRSTQNWLNTLVSAGLYSPPVAVSSGGFFAQTLAQYVATPELSKWRDGSRLCLAKDVELADVLDIGKPQEENIGSGGNAGKLLTVRASLILLATGAAPWLDKSEVQSAVLTHLNQWKFSEGKLNKQVSESFGLRDGQWTTGPAFKAELKKQYGTAARNEERAAVASGGGFFAGLSSRLSSMFSVGSNPLRGKWRMDPSALAGSLGMAMPGGLDITMTFTADSFEVGGQSMKCKFEVDGKRVKVTPEGQPATLIFEMTDNDTATVDMGMMKIVYRRVE
jgi:hypothetical protein